jgi:replicative DNA helicase
MIEQQILGTWLQGKQLDLTATVRSEWFTVPKYRTLCLTIQAMYLNNEHIDNVAVVMKHRDMAMDIAGLNNYYTGESITRLVSMLHQEFIRKTLTIDLTKIVNDLTNGSEIMQSMSEVQKTIDELQLNESGQAIDLITLLGDRFDNLEKRSKSEIKTIGLPTGFTKLDKYIGGFVPGENVVVAGRPGMGKTAFAVSIGIAHAKLGGRVIMFSMEMSKEQLADRILSSLGRVDNLKVRNADVNEFELENIARELLLIDYKFQIEDSTMLDIAQIKTRIKTMKIKPTLVIIDYMQLVKSTGGKNREQEIANISRQCKLIAKECGCTVMPLSQLNRGTEEGNSRPKLANLRESGAIEQDADTVLFPYRPDYYEAQKNGSNPPELENAELIISKCRNGMTGTLQCNFMGKTVEYIF